MVVFVVCSKSVIISFLRQFSSLTISDVEWRNNFLHSRDVPKVTSRAEIMFQIVGRTELQYFGKEPGM